MFRGFWAIFYKETIQLRREKVTFIVLFLIPAFQLLVFGYAINTNIRDISTAVYNLDNRQPSRELLDQLKNTGYFKINRYVTSDAELKAGIVKGDIKVGIKIPPDYSEKILQNRSSEVVVLIDGSDATIAGQAVNATTSVGLVASMQRIVGGNIFTDNLLVAMHPQMLFNPDSNTAHFMVPALCAIILQITTTMLSAMSIVRERENETLEQLLVTPVKPAGLMLGKLLPYVGLSIGEMTVILSVMFFVFHVPIHGSLIVLYTLGLIYIFTALGIGLFMSTVARSQLQASQMAAFVMLPSILLSGYMFPRESMPYLMMRLGNLIPATYFIDVMRGVVLRGAGLIELWPDALALILIGVFFFTMAARRFKKQSG